MNLYKTYHKSNYFYVQKKRIGSENLQKQNFHNIALWWEKKFGLRVNVLAPKFWFCARDIRVQWWRKNVWIDREDTIHTHFADDQSFVFWSADFQFYNKKIC